MSTSPMMTPDPGPEDVSAADLERWLEAPLEPQPLEPQSAELEQVELEQVESDDGPTPVLAPLLTSAETKRVRDLRHEVAEAHLLLALQGDEAALLVDTPKVRKRRMQGAEASRLHALAQNPAVRAWQAARWRLVSTWVAVFALVCALGWSTAGVQAFASESAPAWSPGWLLAWLVEPFMSLALLTVVSAKGFMATRGQPINDPKLKVIEALFLGLTLGMNAWPHLPGVAESFDLTPLVLHVLGPIVAVAIVIALPIIWAAFADLDHGGPVGRPYSPPTAAANWGNAANFEPSVGPSVGAVGPTVEELIARAQWLIDAGHLSPNPSATQLQKVLPRCGTAKACKVRDALRKAQP